MGAQHNARTDPGGLTPLHSDVFHVASGQEEVVLVFGERIPGDDPEAEHLVFRRRVVLSPFAAKRLSRQLDDALQTAERGRDSPERAAAGGDGGSDARRMLDLVRQLGAVYGLERSFKISNGTLLTNRFLTTLAKETVSGPIESRLAALCERIGMPTAFSQMYREHLPFARHVHFGFEESPDGDVCKAYLEFPPGWESAVMQKPAGGDSELLYLGFKWDACAPRRRALTRYTAHPRLPLENILQRLAAHYDGTAQADCRQAVRDIVEAAARRVGAGQVLYLEAREDGNPRSSFDINLYRAKLPLDDCGRQLMRAARHFRISAPAFEAFWDSIRSRRLGHLSGGVDRSGNAFLTVYYGAEGRPGQPVFGGAGFDPAAGSGALT